MFQKAYLKVEAAAAIALILLSSCSQPKNNADTSAIAQPGTVQTVASRNRSPRTIKLKLTLDSPSDLKVERDQLVTKNQMISDRASTRQRLLEQKKQILQRLNSISDNRSDTALEKAKLEAAKQQVAITTEAIQNFKSNSPWTETAKQRLHLPEENQQLAELMNQYRVAQNNLTITYAELKQAEENKGFSTETYTEQSKLEDIEEQLAEAGIVRSPYSGTIKSIRWLGQTDQQLNAEVSLAISEKQVQDVSAQSSAKPSAGFNADWSVISVHDGDTIRVRQGNRTERIRFACIDAPELKQSLGKQSRDHLKGIIAQGGDRVGLNLITTDRYGRQVAEVFVDDELVQSQQISQGMAYVYHKYLSDCPSADAVQQAEQQAKQQKVGVWMGNRQPPWVFRKRK